MTPWRMHNRHREGVKLDKGLKGASKVARWTPGETASERGNLTSEKHPKAEEHGVFQTVNHSQV